MSVHPSIRIEGNLLGPELFDQLQAGDLPGQKPTDFGFQGRRNLTDEIAAVFADARALWGVFQHRLARLPDDDLATTVTRDAWLIPFLGLLGYEPQYNQRAFELDGLTFAISHRVASADDAPPIHIVGARQKLGLLPPSGRPRMAPHSLVQEYLNRSEHLWGMVTNGQTLRLLRDSTFVRRQSYVEFDLAAILEEQRFQDFADLYRLLHRTRLPRGMADASDCLLEQYHAHSVEQGGRVREHLRDGVEDCIKLLANGFLRHSANADLRRRSVPACTGPDRLTPDNLYRQLLRLVYRLLFLLVSEDRGLLSADPLYREHYGIARLRRLTDLRAAYTDHDDLWQSLRVLWLVLVRDEAQPHLGGKTLAATLGLPVLNGELFQQQDLDECDISNRELLQAIWKLSYYRESEAQAWRRVNYAALDVEELGSVYESLLELHPTITSASTAKPAFDLIKGSGRKETGSYYTPPQLVAELIQSALVPVIQDRLAALRKSSHKPSPAQLEKALLGIRVCDPACGSGHFLLAAARHLGKELAKARTGEDEPAPEQVREAIRDVVGHCIYGVDKNPLAVDLCRVALWLESHTSDRPLTFLDHRIRCGDSLVGVFDLANLKDGIPDKAFNPLEGDDKAAAREAMRQNREDRKAGSGFLWNPSSALDSFCHHSHELNHIADDSPAAIRRKRQLYEQGQHDPAWVHQKQACDLYTAAFFQTLRAGTPPITTGSLFEYLAGRSIGAQVMGTATTLSIRHRFFHWPLEFPEIFADSEGNGHGRGFDVILSNPPWERVKLQEQEFFAARDARIANAPTKAARARLIKELSEENPLLHEEFVAALRGASGASSFLRNSDRYLLAGRGDINTYAVFAELCRDGICLNGRAGIIVPSGIATADTTKHFFDDLVQSRSLVSLFSFFEIRKLFPGTDSRDPFCLLTIERGMSPATRTAELVFDAHRVEEIHDLSKRFTLTDDEIALLNPNTRTCPIFRTQADAELTKAIYRRVPILWRDTQGGHPEHNPWRLSFKTLFHMANDSHHFRTAEELAADGYRRERNHFVSPYDRYLPLYEAKMLHQFDHRWATYEGAEDSRNVTLEEKRDTSFMVQPRYWVRQEVVDSVIPQYPEPLAMALRSGDVPGIRRVLCFWAAGYHLNHGNPADAGRLLDAAVLDGNNLLSSAFGRAMNAEASAAEMEHDFPLTGADANAIAERLSDPELIARQLLERFSPRWFLGWRDVCRSNDERTLIAGVVPRTAVGHKFQLMFPAGPASAKLNLLGIVDSFIVDYCARQKLGGTSFSYFVMRQLPVVTPMSLLTQTAWSGTQKLLEWFTPRVLELCCTALDMAAIGRDCGFGDLPFAWDSDRRFEIRCEIDAAMFHIYLPAVDTGDWRVACRADGAMVDETPAQLAALKKRFPTPRHAVAHILDQFNLVRDADERAHARYRTKDRILEVYDAMLMAQRTGQPYQSSLSPPPGSAAL